MFEKLLPLTHDVEKKILERVQQARPGLYAGYRVADVIARVSRLAFAATILTYFLLAVVLSQMSQAGDAEVQKLAELMVPYIIGCGGAMFISFTVRGKFHGDLQPIVVEAARSL